MSALIELKRLSCKVGNNYLLHNVDWKVEEGENWLIFGLNGSGKTTLLSMLAGFSSPSTGEIYVLGERYTRDTIFSLRKNIGWVSNAFYDKYFNNEIVLQIVLSAVTGTFNINESITSEDARNAKFLMRNLGLESKMHLPFRNLSKGERQNVLIARALICRPRILILDEPGSGLDILYREYMQNIVKGLATSGKVTVIYVTHYPSEIKSYMNKTLLLHRGNIIAQGDTNKIFNTKNISRMLNQDINITYSNNGTIKFSIAENKDLIDWYLRKGCQND